MKPSTTLCLAVFVSLAATAAEKNPIAGRVAADFAGQSNAAVWHYAVPPMSEIQRLPDVYPTDGTPGGTVRIVAAKDEYEAGSFLVWATRDLGKVQIELGEFTQVEESDVEKAKAKGEGEQRSKSSVHLHLQPTPTPIFPKENLDLKVVKVWYQNKNGWFSYFGDTGFKLCPELLLNDEDLIRVDTKMEANYARLVDKDGKKKGEHWLNPPRQMDRGSGGCETFQCMREDFRDAATLQPVNLPKNEFRQFFLTAHATKDIRPGLYRGEITILKAKAKGEGEEEAKAKGEGEEEAKAKGEGEEEAKTKGEGEQRNSSSLKLRNSETSKLRNSETSKLRNSETSKLRNSETSKLRNFETLCTIPVELKVLDFSLPEPKCYFEPEKDFFVAAYTYISRGLLKQRNGDNDAIVRKQLLAIFRDQIAHNQKMHWVRGNLDTEAIETYDIMREAGMRMDVFLGGVYPENSSPEAMRAHARLVADEYDRRYGHHNVYMGYGDEPGANWLAATRPLFEAYQGAGLKFIIAGESVFTKAAYIYDWHNSAHQDATSTDVTSLWTRMNGNSHVAWYACQHVGCENPAFNRRQYGLGAYLAGFTAFCNYAHHLGDYNDDRETYKPMVLAYGSYDGVIDTLAWEGFREGVDDIRYATLMTDLARKAQKSADLQTRYLGGKAMQFMALTDGKTCDQDSVRGEMIRHILALKDKVAPYAVKTDVPAPSAAASEAAKKRSDAALAKAIENAKKAMAKDNLNAQHAAIAKVYDRFGRVEEAAAYRKANGLDRKDIWARLEDDASLVKTAFDAEVFAGIRPAETNRWRYAIAQAFTYYYSLPRLQRAQRPAAYAAAYEHLLPIARKWGAPVPATAAQGAVWAYLQLQNPKGAAMAAREGLRDEKAKASVRYCLGLAAALENVRGKPEAYFAAAKRFDATQKDVANKDRVAGLCTYGSFAMEANGEDAVRGLNDFRKSLYKPEPKKRYVVRFSETPIAGIADWDKVRAEKQVYDRRYGGSMDFLATDVTTGTRAVGNSKETLEKPTMEVVADAKGIHVLVRFADPKAREIELGLVGNCSFEGYIAPGKNTPYVCFIYTPEDGRVALFNSTYDTCGGVRTLEASDVGRKTIFTTDYADGEVRHYFFFAWENWMQRVPEDGAVWDFENMCWHRAGNCAWNGTESIHGRSTWGEFEFRLTPEQRAKILRGLLVKAYRGYCAERDTNALRDGALAHWQDSALGDPAFYAAKVKPLRDELDAYAKLITPDMTDKTVFWLEKNALGRWQDIRFEIERRRAAWLLDKNADL